MIRTLFAPHRRVFLRPSPVCLQIWGCGKARMPASRAPPTCDAEANGGGGRCRPTLRQALWFMGSASGRLRPTLASVGVNLGWARQAVGPASGPPLSPDPPNLETRLDHTWPQFGQMWARPNLARLGRFWANFALEGSCSGYSTTPHRQSGDPLRLAGGTPPGPDLDPPATTPQRNTPPPFATIPPLHNTNTNTWLTPAWHVGLQVAFCGPHAGLLCA